MISLPYDSVGPLHPLRLKDLNRMMDEVRRASNVIGEGFVSNASGNHPVQRKDFSLTQARVVSRSDFPGPYYYVWAPIIVNSDSTTIDKEENAVGGYIDEDGEYQNVLIDPADPLGDYPLSLNEVVWITWDEGSKYWILVSRSKAETAFIRVTSPTKIGELYSAVRLENNNNPYITWPVLERCWLYSVRDIELGLVYPYLARRNSKLFQDLDQWDTTDCCEQPTPLPGDYIVPCCSLEESFLPTRLCVTPNAPPYAVEPCNQWRTFSNEYIGGIVATWNGDLADPKWYFSATSSDGCYITGYLACCGQGSTLLPTPQLGFFGTLHSKNITDVHCGNLGDGTHTKIRQPPYCGDDESFANYLVCYPTHEVTGVGSGPFSEQEVILVISHTCSADTISGGSGSGGGGDPGVIQTQCCDNMWPFVMISTFTQTGGSGGILDGVSITVSYLGNFSGTDDWQGSKVIDGRLYYVTIQCTSAGDSFSYVISNGTCDVQGLSGEDNVVTCGPPVILTSLVKTVNVICPTEPETTYIVTTT